MYDYDDKPKGQDLLPPDAVIRLASVVHRFRCPEMGSKKLSYVKSFKSASTSHETSQALMREADETRTSLLEALAGSRTDSTSRSRSINISHESVASAARQYVPNVNRILLSCKVQPDTARLDEKLIFEWTSGIEGGAAKNRKKFSSEALMYELVMTVCTEGLGIAGMACDDSTAGNFKDACRHFKEGAGLFEYLAQDQLPKWIARGSSVNSDDLPSEATPGVCEAIKLLYLASAQQMAIATVLVKPGTPNYSLLAKLCLGVAEQLDASMNTFRSKASNHMPRLDPSFFKLMAFETVLQRGLSSYFLSRATWDESEYGVAIALLNDAIETMRTRESPVGKGLPETDKKSGLEALHADVETMKRHFAAVQRAWKKDNSTIFFEKVPFPVPEESRLTQGLMMMKAEKYILSENVEPVLLSPPTTPANLGFVPPSPAHSLQRTDSGLARELQARLNAGEDS